MRKRSIFKALLIIMVCAAMALPGAARQEKLAALTFDDGPSGRFTRRLLEGLEQRDVKATFFLCGYRMESYPELTREIRDRGHEIGLHGYTHDCMGSMSPEVLARELDDTDRLLTRLTGEGSDLLRPPGGAFGAEVRAAARQRELAIVTWSVDPRDWATDDRAEIVRRVLADTGDGDIILLHDMSDSSVDAALEIIDRLTEQGFRFVTVSELARLRQEPLLPGCIFSSFP